MPELTQEVTKGLILDDPSRRLTLEEMLESEWLSRSAADFETPQKDEAQWLVIPHTSPEPSKWLAPYLGGSRPLTISSFIGSQQVHLFNQRLADLDLHALTAVLLVRQPGTEDTFVNPNEDITLTEGMHVYLGIPADSQDTDAAVEAAQQLFTAPQMKSQSRGGRSSFKSAVVKYDLHDVTTAYTPSNKRGVAETGAMYSFAMEFDSFRFPQHIGHEATIGKEALPGPRREFNDVGHIALDLKDTFHINLVGIQRVGEDSAEWFPDPISLVRPGDLGIVARCPMRDGGSKPSVEEETLARLMVEERFNDAILARRDPARAPVEVGIARKESFTHARLYRKPWDGQEGVNGGIVKRGIGRTRVYDRGRFGHGTLRFFVLAGGSCAPWGRVCPFMF
ncbi:unnamed protein product [Prorocentrum cordatum]|uniref:Protein kinase domain-containing protein n=1 Tax=Prorocentrum cordatum TaxID=2364126 RepID=A0ABN9Q9S7_9DINO|nr:unnamed protein product [Polarella glacialis]